MNDDDLEEIIFRILKKNAGGFGLWAKTIKKNYLPDNIDITSRKIGQICGKSDNIIKDRESKVGGRWNIKERVEDNRG